MTSNDNFIEKYNPPYTGSSRGMTSYLSKSMIVLSAQATTHYKIYSYKSADLFVNTTHGKPEVWVFLYKESGTGKFKVNFLGKTCRISIMGFANYYDFPLPIEKSEPFDLREVKIDRPVDRSFKTLPDLCFSFFWPKVKNPQSKEMRKVKKLLKKPIRNP